MLLCNGRLDVLQLCGREGTSIWLSRVFDDESSFASQRLCGPSLV